MRDRVPFRVIYVVCFKGRGEIINKKREAKLKTYKIGKVKGLRGIITPPPDKSISHRALMFASIAAGKSRIVNILRAGDTTSTLKAMEMLGVTIQESQGEITLSGKGLRGLSEPDNIIDCGNSGTTTRLLSGILAGNDFFATLTGDDSLRQRPMQRVIVPLRQMGASILARKGDRYLPMSIRGGGLKGIDYVMPMSSAQVKSCLILAGLYAAAETRITEPLKSRDHTEKMLISMGVRLHIDGNTLTLTPPTSELTPIDVYVPADFSSASFFIAAALLVPNSELVIRDVLLNPTRTGLLQALQMMGADIELKDVKDVAGEKVGTLVCKTSSNMKAINIGPEMMPSMVDEFPILCVIASRAEGVTKIRGAEELRVKESDRIKAMAKGLTEMGVEVAEYPDGLDIRGSEGLVGARVNSFGDHRIAMSMAVAGLVAEGDTIIEDTDCVSISFPKFFDTLMGCVWQ